MIFKSLIQIFYKFLKQPVHGDEDMHVCMWNIKINRKLPFTPINMNQTQHLHVKGNAYGLILGTPYLFWGCPLPRSLVFTLHNSTLNLTNS
jgi:hypothetical protein